MLERYTTYLDLVVGGTATGEALQPIYKKAFHLAKHSTAAEIQDVMGLERFRSYYTFAIVRNPYTRAYSTYNWLFRQYKLEKRLAQRTLNKMSGLDGTFSQFVRSDYFKTVGEDRVFRPQRFWTALQGGQKLSYVGSVESLEKDITAMLAQINGRQLDACAKSPPPPEPMKRNESTDKPDRIWELLREEPELEKLIYLRYKPDFDTFGYRRFNVASSEAYDPSRIPGFVPKV